MANKRDIELLLKATDLTAKPFADVSAAIKGLTAALGTQTEAASKGEIKASELYGTLRKLGEAGRSLANQQGVIDSFKKTGESLAAAEEKATKLRAEYDALKATLEGQETVTKKQSSALNSLGNSATTAEERVTRFQATLERQGAALAQAGIETSNLAHAEAALAVAAAETGNSLRVAQEAIDQYDTRLREHKALVNAAAAAEKTKAEQAVTNAKEVKAAEAEQAAAAAAAAAAETKRLAAIQEASRAAFESDKVIAALRAKDVQAAAAQRIAAENLVLEADRKVKAEQAALLKSQMALIEEAEQRNRASLARSAADNAKQTSNMIANFKAVKTATSPAGGSATGNSETRDTGILGLKRYELENLSYQINDIITGLSSGQKVSQVLAQQGGQVFQIFERQIGNLVSILPKLLAGAAIITAITAVFVRAANTASSLRDFNAQLAISTDGAKYNAQAIVLQQRALQSLGADFDEAGKALKHFIQAGIDPSKLMAFGKAAEELSRVFGINLVEAAKEVTSAFTLGYDAVTKLDNSYNFLTVAQKEAIRELFDTGKAVEAQNLAFGIFNEKVKGASEIVGGPFTSAFRTARAAIYDLLDLLANSLMARLAGTAIGLLAQGLSNAATGLRVILDTLPGGKGIDNDPAFQQTLLDRLKKERAALAAAPVGPQSLAPGTDPNQFTEQRIARLGGYDQAIDALTKKIATLNKVQGEGEAGEIAAGAARTKRGNDVLDDISRQIAKARGLNDVQRAVEAGKTAADRVTNAGGTPKQSEEARGLAKEEEERVIGLERLAQERALQAQLQSLNAASLKGQKFNLQAQLDGIDEQYKTAYQKLDDFVRRGGTTIQGKSPDAYRADLDTAKEQQKADARAKIGEKSIKEQETLQQKLASIIEAGDKAQKGNLDAQLDAVTQKYSSIARKIDDYQRHGGGDIGGMSVDAYKGQVLAQEELIKQQVTIKFYTDNINEAVAARKELFASINDQVKDGEITAKQAYDEAAKANDRIAPKIAEMARAALQFAEAMNKAHPSAQLEAFIAKTTHTLTESTGPVTSPTSAIGAESKNITTTELAKINELEATRNELQKAFTELAAKGVITHRDANAEIERAYKDAKPAIDAATASLQAYVDAQNAAGNGSVQLDLVAAKLKEVGANAEYANPEFTSLKKSIGDAFGRSAMTAIDSMAQAIGSAIAKTKSWGQAFQDIGRASAQFFASLLQDIAKAILQKQILALVDKVMLLHGGGTVGEGGSSGGMSRAASPSWFVGAPRYHDGTVVGLGADEQAAILQKGEEVLAKDDPRNVLNSVKKAGNASGGGAQSIRNVLVLDESLIPQAMNSAHGETVTMAHIKKNLPTIRQMIGR